MAKILIVEDDENTANIMSDFLKAQSHDLDVTDSGAEAREKLFAYQYDLIILDVGLPDDSGLSVCRDFRARGGATPVIFLTGRNHLEDKETGFDAGADDYVTKPFQIRELAARIKAILRRPSVLKGDNINVGAFELDSRAKRLTKSGVEISLSPREFALFEFFMRNTDQVFSPEAILDRVWPSESDATDETLRTCLKKLRKKIDNPGEPSVIKNITNTGYRLDSK